MYKIPCPICKGANTWKSGYSGSGKQRIYCRDCNLKRTTDIRVVPANPSGTSKRTRVVEDILFDAFKTGATIDEACRLAKISPETFRSWCATDARFAGDIECCRVKDVEIARKSVTEHMVDDGKLALDYLKAKQVLSEQPSTAIQINFNGETVEFKTNR